MSHDTWFAVKFAVGLTLTIIVGTLIILALCSPSDNDLAGRANSVVQRCGATGQDVTTRSWLGERWAVQCRDGKSYACSGASHVRCAER